MRESLYLRIAALAVVLPLMAAVCVFALVVTGALHPRIAYLVLAGGAILVIAVLAAALSALGPKYRPTPFLTPLFAGVFAALLASTAVYAAHAYVTPKRSAVATVDIKPATKAAKASKTAKSAVKPAEAAPVEQASAGGDAAQLPPGFMPMFDTAAFAPAEKAQDQLPLADQPPTKAADQLPATAEVQPLPADAADRAAMGGPLVDVPDAMVTPVKAEEKSGTAKPGKQPTVAVAKIPVPAKAPQLPGETAKADANTPRNLAASFDASGPILPAADGPPMALDGAEAAGAAPAHHAAIPPLPRIRPCGGDGPACP